MKYTVYCFPNGNTAVFDNRGEQVPEMQIPWIRLLFKHLQFHGVDLEKDNVIFNLPNGMKAKPFKVPDGEFNWEVESYVTENHQRS